MIRVLECGCSIDNICSVDKDRQHSRISVGIRRVRSLNQGA